MEWLQYRKRYELLQPERIFMSVIPLQALQYRKRYELLQHIGNAYLRVFSENMLQYRKRYELLQLMKMFSQARKKQKLQYRKRYELLQHGFYIVLENASAAVVTIPQAV